MTKYPEINPQTKKENIKLGFLRLRKAMIGFSESTQKQKHKHEVPLNGKVVLNNTSEITFNVTPC